MLQHSFVDPQIQDNPKSARKTQFSLRILRISMHYFIILWDIGVAGASAPHTTLLDAHPHLPHPHPCPPYGLWNKTCVFHPQFQSMNAEAAVACKQSFPLPKNSHKERAWTVCIIIELFWIEQEHFMAYSKQGVFPPLPRG